MSPPGSSIVRVVVTDTNILINLIHIGRLDLLGKLPPYSFVVPEEVVKEVREPQQAQALQTAMSSGLLLEVRLADPAELKLYADLIQILGSGEAACSPVSTTNVPLSVKNRSMSRSNSRWSTLPSFKRFRRLTAKPRYSDNV
jgi:hypothetical protein